MLNIWAVILTAIGYLLILFAIASFGDRGRGQLSPKSSPYIYSLSMAVYCTTWTFFGSVGVAATGGLDFLAIYVGPALLITFGHSLVRKVVRLSRTERITSIADFLGARYGKNMRVAAVATLIAVIGTIPYIALQLKAISSSVSILAVQYTTGFEANFPIFGDISLLITAMLAAFTILFGTRHADATEHQGGLILAIAMESVVKLAAFLAVGIFVTWFVFDGFSDLIARVSNSAEISAIVARPIISPNFLVLTALSACVFLLLPREFHVSVVENHSESELETAKWLFPLYLLLINIFVIPITYAGLLMFGHSVNPDNFVLALPLHNQNITIALFTFIGGISAGTAMVVVASVAIAIMISNDVVLPIYLRYREKLHLPEKTRMEGLILNIRRTAILVILTLAFVYYKAADNSAALASIGLISFAAIAQLAPAFFGGLFWRRATAKGAMAGMVAGTLIWAYTLFIPTLLQPENTILIDGPMGINLLRPHNLMGLGWSSLANGVLWSLLINTLALIGVSLATKQHALEIVQATVFVSFHSGRRSSAKLANTRATVGELTKTVARFLGEERTERAFANYWRDARQQADQRRIVNADILLFSEQLLASAIGSSSSRLVHSLLLKRFDLTSVEDIQLLDEASEALRHNQDVLQTALDQLNHGITVFDQNMRLASWNRQFRNLLRLPPEIGQAGTSLAEIAASIIKSNRLDSSGPDSRELATRLLNEKEPWQLKLNNEDLIIEIRTSTMPGGGMVVTWNDITGSVLAAEALKDANETLERRVEERTRDLMVLNKQLELARLEADQANVSKTRFLASTGHDILQPLNAARLYTSALHEKLLDHPDQRLISNISASLESVEEILGAILAISRLDTARLEIKTTRFAVNSILEQMEIEFLPAARAKGLELKIIPTSVWTQSDQSLLRRLVQNLISNAIKYTRHGKVLVGVRRRGKRISIEVLDTGIGIADDATTEIFGEFKRLDEGAREAPGLGLGLSIVDRIANVLGLRVQLQSRPGIGTRFAIELDRVEASVEMLAQRISGTNNAITTLNHTRILCIDNEVAILSGMVALLTQWQCSVDTATSLAEALRAIETSGVPDIILADYHLGKANGLDAVAAIRLRHGNIPAVLITADRTVELKEMATAANVSLLNKPVKPARLRAMISHEKSSRLEAV